MPLIHITLTLPYLLRLPSERYHTGAEGGFLDLSERYVEDVNGLGAKYTAVSSDFDAPDYATPEQRLVRKKAEADRLLRRVNRLMRWYRTVTGQAGLVELTRVQAGPFAFTISGTAQAWTADEPPLQFENASPLLPNSLSTITVADSIRRGLAGQTDPAVAELFLLDAEQALRAGRFREAVLFCWSTIDSTSNSKYDALVDQALVEEWSEGRQWLKDPRFGMRNKMSAVMYLLTGRSLFREPDDLWQKLTESYRKRNAIIHQGEIA
ncbi:MAG: hypothetical protein M3Y28_06020 [Armatimonadota bacterium]|nr:hypothetical protein [Armatimonadota bacterium]